MLILSSGPSRLTSLVTHRCISAGQNLAEACDSSEAVRVGETCQPEERRKAALAIMAVLPAKARLLIA